MSNKTLIDLNPEFANTLYTLIRNGLVNKLDQKLSNVSNPAEYLTTIYQNDQEQLSLLMVAALRGCEDTIRILFKYCEPKYQIELEGAIKIDDHTTLHGVTALYCACYRGNFSAAKILIEVGQANVHHCSLDEPYHPLLIHAVRMNRLDIVQFLIGNGYVDAAQTRSTTAAKTSALAWAIRRNYLPIVRYLVEHGADVNYYCSTKFSSKHMTPLTLAVHNGSLELVEVLCNAGANIQAKNKSGDSVTALAIKREHWSIVQFLFERSLITIEDVEIGILSLLEERTFRRDTKKLHTYLQFALQQRLTTRIPKICQKPLEIYDHHEECRTLEELKAIRDDDNRIWIEILLMCERIFLPKNDPKLAKILNYYSNFLLCKDQYIKCIDLWIHSFIVCKRMQFKMNLYPFVGLFCKMITVEKIIPIDRFIQVCDLTFDTGQTNRPGSIAYNQLCFVVIAANILKYQQVTHDEKTAISTWVGRLCRQWQSPSDRQTLVHLCITGDNYGVNVYPKSRYAEPYLRFPNESALQLVLSCGYRWLNLDAVESSMNNTALHLLCHKSENPMRMIQMLLDFGAHIDYVNGHGLTPFMYATSQKTKDFLQSKSAPSHLKCLCANKINHLHLNSNGLGILWPQLNTFISLHKSSLTAHNQH